MRHTSTIRRARNHEHARVACVRFVTLYPLEFFNTSFFISRVIPGRFWYSHTYPTHARLFVRSFCLFVSEYLGFLFLCFDRGLPGLILTANPVEPCNECRRRLCSLSMMSKESPCASCGHIARLAEARSVSGPARNSPTPARWMVNVYRVLHIKLQCGSSSQCVCGRLYPKKYQKNTEYSRSQSLNVTPGYHGMARS